MADVILSAMMGPAWAGVALRFQVRDLAGNALQLVPHEDITEGANGYFHTTSTESVPNEGGLLDVLDVDGTPIARGVIEADIPWAVWTQYPTRTLTE